MESLVKIEDAKLKEERNKVRKVQPDSVRVQFLKPVKNHIGSEVIYGKVGEEAILSLNEYNVLAKVGKVRKI